MGENKDITISRWGEGEFIFRLSTQLLLLVEQTSTVENYSLEVFFTLIIMIHLGIWDQWDN